MSQLGLLLNLNLKMRSTSLAVLASIILLAQTVEAGWFFNDVRPKSFPKGRTLDILVGHLHSPQSMHKYEFYSLPYCGGSSGKNHYKHDEEIEVKEAPEGVSMFDDDLHDSFFQVSY